MANGSGHKQITTTLLFGLCLSLICSYAWFAIKAFRAQWSADHPGRAFIEQAIALAPQNAEFHESLCRNIIFGSQEPAKAVAECRIASQLNPYSSSIWLDLAQAYYSAGNIELNNAAIHHALDVDPTTPDTAWNAANFFLIRGGTEEALKQFAVVLREDPSLVEPTLNICWQSLHNASRIQSILPQNPEVFLAFIKLLLSSGELGAARQTWSTLMQSAMSLDYHHALFYVDSLLDAHAVIEADQAWKQLASKSAQLRAYSEPGNLITDGSFAEEILASGFDWRFTPRLKIAATLDKSEFHTGDRSLRLVYNDSGSDAGISQYIAVQPNTQYRLSAWVKSDHLETANGPALTVFDSDHHAMLGSTGETVGTTEWHQVESELQTGPNTQLIVFVIERHPGETRIQGTFWVDDIVLKAIS
jgi:hypothetical protein